MTFLEWLLQPIFESLKRVEAKLKLLLQKGDSMSAELDALKAQVEANKTIAQSVLILVQGLAQKIIDLANAGGTPQQFLDLATSLKADDDALAAAVAANTPPGP